MKLHSFETAHGWVAVAWNAKGIAALRLPSATPTEAERAITRRTHATPAAPPPHVAAIIEAIRHYFTGEPIDFTTLPLDLGEQDALFTQVYAYVRALPWGTATTYGAVAKAIGGGPETARDVGQAMANNPIPLIVPCHRVLAAGNRIGGFSAPGGSHAKARMLELEGIPFERTDQPKPSPQTSFGF